MQSLVLQQLLCKKLSDSEEDTVNNVALSDVQGFSAYFLATMHQQRSLVFLLAVTELRSWFGAFPVLERRLPLYQSLSQCSFLPSLCPSSIPLPPCLNIWFMQPSQSWEGSPLPWLPSRHEFLWTMNIVLYEQQDGAEVQQIAHVEDVVCWKATVQCGRNWWHCQNVLTLNN